MRCPLWPLDSRYRVFNGDVISVGGTVIYFFGPGSRGTAWVIMAATYIYPSPKVVGGLVTPYYQHNEGPEERAARNRVPLGNFRTDNNLTIPLIGGGNSTDTTTAAPTIVPQRRPLYVPYPHEFAVLITSAPASPLQFRLLVYQAQTDEDVSMFL